MGSVVFNYLISKKIDPGSEALGANEVVRKRYLFFAIFANLLVLGIFKYANFFISNTNLLLSGAGIVPIDTLELMVPIGISFYTFTQIAFLVDCWAGKVREKGFAYYLLFVTYFPHLLAGPVLHHSQMIPQFLNDRIYRISFDKIALGLVFLSVGFAKKLLIADPLGTYADYVFHNAKYVTSNDLIMSWCGVLAYTFQIYFDFSGYSDMAIGISLFFGIYLPLNFNSPYKATSIIDFWRRWHISLSTFLRDYLYKPLGGNRNGPISRYKNIMITMLLGGLWHGAGWTFVMWGAAHGVLLIINHIWRSLIGYRIRYGRIGQMFCGFVTFMCVCLTFVLFRADSAQSALYMYKGMFGLHGIKPVENYMIFVFLCLASSITFFGKNIASIAFENHDTNKNNYSETRLIFVSNYLWLIFSVSLFVLSLLAMHRPTPFLYFDF